MHEKKGLTTGMHVRTVGGMYDPTDVLTLRETSTYLKLHPMTTYKLVRTRKIPMRKIGGQWRIRFDTLSSWLTTTQEALNV